MIDGGILSSYKALALGSDLLASAYSDDGSALQCRIDKSDARVNRAGIVKVLALKHIFIYNPRH
jgi:hypothetical protein